MKNVKSTKDMKKNIILALVWVLMLGGAIFLSNKLLAHSELLEAMPADGAVMHEGPEHVMLEFTEEVRLMQFSVTDSTMHAVEVGFSPVADAAESFSVMMPSLATGTYTVKWTAMGDDSHRIEGEYSFIVDPTAMEHMGGNEQMQEHHDEHAH